LKESKKAKLEEIKQGITEYVNDVMAGDRSTDALVLVMSFVDRAIGTVDDCLSDIQGSFNNEEAQLATGCIPATRFKDSPFWDSKKEKQIKDWVQDNDTCWQTKAESDRVVKLRKSLAEIKVHLAGLEAIVRQVDGVVESFAKDCRTKAEEQRMESINEESGRVTCEHLITADEYESFIKQFDKAFENNEGTILKTINERATSEFKTSLLEALASKTKGRLDKAKSIREDACRAGAMQELKEYNLADHIARITEEDGNDDRLRQMLRNLARKAGPWLKYNQGKLGAKAKDQLTVDHYFIYPQGAEDIKETFLEM
jgi:hypothetical protein